MKELSLAIISDLHCHPEDFTIDGKAIDDTYLKTDMLRSNILNHPVESLLKLVEDESNLTVDLTICPGDFTNKSNRQGLISGWNYCLEINKALNGEEIVGTIGNHDVDSFLNYSNYSFANARGVKNKFPFAENTQGSLKNFWSVGGAFLEKESCRILIINSCHFHQNKVSSVAGEVSDELLDYIEDYLKSIDDDKIFICLTHHHPIDHSMLDLGEKDKIVNSQRLISLLGKYKVDLFIHGHKHHALLRHYICDEHNYQIPIFSAGSFSATTNHSWTQKRNHFHVINIKKNGKLRAKGRIRTWTFLPRNGWKINADDFGFEPYTGFGFVGDLDRLCNQILEFVKVGDNKKWGDVVDHLPDLMYLNPLQTDELEKLFKNNGVVLNCKISQKPEYIFRVK